MEALHALMSSISWHYLLPKFDTCFLCTNGNPLEFHRAYIFYHSNSNLQKIQAYFHQKNLKYPSPLIKKKKNEWLLPLSHNIMENAAEILFRNITESAQTPTKGHFPRTVSMRMNRS